VRSALSPLPSARQRSERVGETEKLHQEPVDQEVRERTVAGAWDSGIREQADIALEEVIESVEVFPLIVLGRLRTRFHRRGPTV
jgi:hypothetical protein